MRALYLLIGLLLGIIFTSKISIAICDYLTYTYEREISIYTLVGFYEGWQRGSYYTNQIYRAGKESRD